jgi:cytochrome P450
LALLVRARGEHGSALSDAELRDELVTLVLAGHETTATAIAWACDLLAHNPGVTRLIRGSVEAGSREYLKAAAKEVLRARTLLYATAARIPLEPLAVGNWMVGRDALILVDAQGLHGDPELYPQPDAFRPERFLENPPDGYAFIPFGGGAHRCLGASLAMLELETFLELVVTRVDLEPAGPPARAVRRGPTLVPSNDGKFESCGVRMMIPLSQSTIARCPSRRRRVGIARPPAMLSQPGRRRSRRLHWRLSGSVRERPSLVER